MAALDQAVIASAARIALIAAVQREAEDRVVASGWGWRRGDLLSRAAGAFNACAADRTRNRFEPNERQNKQALWAKRAAIRVAAADHEAAIAALPNDMSLLAAYDLTAGWPDTTADQRGLGGADASVLASAGSGNRQAPMG